MGTRALPHLPTGTVTFLFTDVEKSTQRWESHRGEMQTAVERHDSILRDRVETNNGAVFKTVGDSFCAAFHTPADALAAALGAQDALSRESWPEGCALKVRMALHVGAAQERDHDYFGPALNRVARLLSAGHGEQILVSLPCAEMLRDTLSSDVSLRDLGEHRLKDLLHPEHVFQVVAPGLPADFPPIRTEDARPNNLPPQVTTFVGRQRDVSRVRELLSQKGLRLLTLTGPGGTGKTRLALQTAQDLLDDFRDGVFFVSLSSVTDPDLVPEVVARALNAHLPAAPDSTVEDLLRTRELLLVIDNFEQVLPAAPFLSGLLSVSPGLTLLVTSRAVLGLYGEQDYPVSPLSTPDPKAASDPDALVRFDAVSLFVQRAQSVRPDFALTEANATSIAGICSRLDGLPLAIELAAARIRLLPPRALLARLSRRLDVLTSGSRDLPARQQTLRGALDWSFDALNEADQILFTRLSVFADGCTLEAVEAVTILDGDHDLDAFEAISSLVNWSLLREQTDPAGEPRFVMLETIREYASERLDQRGESDVLRRRHAVYFAKLAGDAAAATGARQDALLQPLAAEHANLRTALGWALEAEEAHMAAALASALWDSGLRIVART
jgi:predicted ATPase/class 3 adenylate cyclase